MVVLASVVVVVSTLWVRNEDYFLVPAPRVPLRATEEPGWDVQFHCVRKSQKKLLDSITFCKRSATSCVKVSFRAADCCSTRIAPSAESCGKGGSTRGIVAGVEP